MTTTETIGVGASRDGAISIPLGALPPGLSVPMPTAGSTPVEYAEALGEAYLSFSRHNHRKNEGHYVTPGAIARFMADYSTYSEPHLRVLDPGSGTGILSAAVCEAACNGTVKSLHVDAYETDPLLACLTGFVLSFACNWLDQRGIALTFEARHGDFVLDNASVLQSTTNANGQRAVTGGTSTGYNLVISNPPYFKIGKDDPRAVAWTSVVHGQPNIYALFMAISAELLSESGKLVYIVPRSFASGTYFRRFRGSLLPTRRPHSHPSLRVQKGRLQKPDGASGESCAHGPGAAVTGRLSKRLRSLCPTAEGPTISPIGSALE